MSDQPKECEGEEVWVPTVECDGKVYAAWSDIHGQRRVTSLLSEALKFESRTTCQRWCDIVNKLCNHAYVPTLVVKEQL